MKCNPDSKIDPIDATPDDSLRSYTPNTMRFADLVRDATLADGEADCCRDAATATTYPLKVTATNAWVVFVSKGTPKARQ